MIRRRTDEEINMRKITRCDDCRTMIRRRTGESLHNLETIRKQGAQ